jgi:hypothetical protein
MATIADKVAAIRQALFGKDVRESIASGIEAINTEVESTTARQNQIDFQEQTRQSNEIIRENNESVRISNENDRINDENARQENELNRETSESQRETIFLNNENDRGIQFNSLKTDLIDSINNANDATTRTNTAITEYSSVVEQTKKIYKQAVATYNNILTTYPNPEIGWTVITDDTSIEYRWDGVEWLPIGVTNVFMGYNIVISSSQPTNPNLIWLDSPETTKYARIYPSPTEPTDTNQIWWEED